MAEPQVVGNGTGGEVGDRLQRLYPAVNQLEHALPRAWSPKDKYSYIGLSQGNLRVHYKGMMSAVLILQLCNVFRNKEVEDSLYSSETYDDCQLKFKE